MGQRRSIFARAGNEKDWGLPSHYMEKRLAKPASMLHWAQKGSARTMPGTQAELAEVKLNVGVQDNKCLGRNLDTGM